MINLDNMSFQELNQALVEVTTKIDECNEGLYYNKCEMNRIKQLINTKRELLGNLESADKDSCYEYNVLKIELEDHKKDLECCKFSKNTLNGRKGDLSKLYWAINSREQMQGTVYKLKSIKKEF